MAPAANLNLFGDCTGPLSAAERQRGECVVRSRWPDVWRHARTIGATLEDGEPQPCGAITSSVWYRFAVRAVTLSTAGSDYANVIALYIVMASRRRRCR